MVSSRLRLRDLVLLNYAGNQQVTSQNCNCTHIFSDVPQLNITNFLSTFVERPLCCLAFHHILHCSVFKVQSPVSLETRSKRTTTCPLPSIFNSRVGGDSRDRTGDLLLARQALSQLSYIPICLLLDCWWARVGSNHRPYDYQSYALAS